MYLIFFNKFKMIMILSPKQLYIYIKYSRANPVIKGDTSS